MLGHMVPGPSFLSDSALSSFVHLDVAIIRLDDSSGDFVAYDPSRLVVCCSYREYCLCDDRAGARSQHGGCGGSRPDRVWYPFRRCCADAAGRLD